MSVSLVIAVAAHVLIFGVGIYLLSDYVPGAQPASTQRRLTQKQFDEAMQHVPIIEGIIMPPSIVEQMPTESSAAWAEFASVTPGYETLPLVVNWTWQPDPRLTTPIDATGAFSRSPKR